MNTNTHSRTRDLLHAMKSPVGWLGALVLALLIGCGQQLDGHDERKRAKRIEQEQKQAARDERRQRAAQDMCSSDFGPQVLAVWVDSFSVECLNRRGRRLASFSME